MFLCEELLSGASSFQELFSWLFRRITPLRRSFFLKYVLFMFTDTTQARTRIQHNLGLLKMKLRRHQALQKFRGHPQQMMTMRTIGEEWEVSSLRQNEQLTKKIRAPLKSSQELTPNPKKQNKQTTKSDKALEHIEIRGKSVPVSVWRLWHARALFLLAWANAQSEKEKTWWC